MSLTYDIEVDVWGSIFLYSAINDKPSVWDICVVYNKQLLCRVKLENGSISIDKSTIGGNKQ
jgi:hypothetical protein